MRSIASPGTPLFLDIYNTCVQINTMIFCHVFEYCAFGYVFDEQLVESELGEHGHCCDQKRMVFWET